MLVAVYRREVRRRRVEGEQGGGFVPFALEAGAVPAAGLVAACYEDHPLLRGFGRGWVRGEDGFVVGDCERGYGQGGYFGGGGCEGGFQRGRHGGDGGGEGAEEGGEEGGGLFDERFLDVLGGGEGGEGEGEEVGEMHGCRFDLRRLVLDRFVR